MAAFDVAECATSATSATSGRKPARNEGSRLWGCHGGASTGRVNVAARLPSRREAPADVARSDRHSQAVVSGGRARYRNRQNAREPFRAWGDAPIDVIHEEA